MSMLVLNLGGSMFKGGLDIPRPSEQKAADTCGDGTGLGTKDSTEPQKKKIAFLKWPASPQCNLIPDDKEPKVDVKTVVNIYMTDCIANFKAATIS